MKDIRALILMHPGFEEMEAIAPIDLLRRAEIEVTLANTTEEDFVSGRGGITVRTTESFEEAKAKDLYDVVIVPGGPGVKALRHNDEIGDFLRKHHDGGKLVACICAAPLLLLDAGLLPVHYTAHPSTLAELPKPGKEDCVWEGGILTSKGAGTATQFALALIEALMGEAKREEIEASVCWSS